MSEPILITEPHGGNVVAFRRSVWCEIIDAARDAVCENGVICDEWETQKADGTAVIYSGDYVKAEIENMLALMHSMREVMARSFPPPSRSRWEAALRHAGAIR